MSYKVLFRKREMDPEYSVGSYYSHTLAMVAAKGEYYYRGGMTPTYRIVKCSEKPHRLPEHLYEVLTRVVGFLSTEEQEVFRDEHFVYLRTKGLV